MAETIKTPDPNRIAFQGEPSINLAFARLYGRAPKSRRMKEGIQDVRFLRKSVASLNIESQQIKFKLFLPCANQ
jgi:hypothetical protein